VQSPDRGADGGKDLIVQENVPGITGVHSTRWLVSCKHYAHTQKSVGVEDETDISDRILQHHCDGFMGFYSTIPSSGLNTRLQELNSRFKTAVYDKASIESTLLDLHDDKHILFRRYFPDSYKRYVETDVRNNPKPAQIFSDELSIKCECCGKELMGDLKHGNIVFWHRGLNDKGLHHYERAYIACKGKCDSVLKYKMLQESGYELLDSWQDFNSFTNPSLYIKQVMSWLNSFSMGETMDSDAYSKLKKVFLNTYPLICRELTDEETEIIKQANMAGAIEFL